MPDRRSLLNSFALLTIVLVLLAVGVVASAATRMQTAKDLAAAQTLLAPSLNLLIGQLAVIGVLAITMLWESYRQRQDELRSREFVASLESAYSAVENKLTEMAVRNRELDDFAMIAAHDLKEPLRGIATYCELLLADYSDRVDADGRRRMRGMVAVCRRLTDLIDELLAYAQAGRQSPRRQQVDLHEVLHDVLQTLEPTIDGRRAEVRIHGRLPALNADPALISEVFRNLIANALIHNQSGCPNIEIGCQPGATPTIYVRDNGPGIPVEQQHAVFSILHRPHTGGNSRSGMGLAIVRKIVELHGGRIWVDSTPNRGATFYFTLSPPADLGSSAGRPHWSVSKSPRKVQPNV